MAKMGLHQGILGQPVPVLGPHQQIIPGRDIELCKTTFVIAMLQNVTESVTGIIF